MLCCSQRAAPAPTRHRAASILLDVNPGPKVLRPAQEPPMPLSRHSCRLRLEPLEVRAVPATFFVAPSGSDAAPGSNAAPWLTLQHAANQVRAGDSVIVRAGDYVGFDLRTDGTAAAPITF